MVINVEINNFMMPNKHHLSIRLMKMLLISFIWLTTLLIGLCQSSGKFFTDHGIASPISNHRGLVCTVDESNNNVVLAWLFDHTGGYSLLMVDAETGESDQFPMPFPTGGDTPYSSLLSKSNKFYTLFNGYFVEFDPLEKKFTYYHAVNRQMAMSMTEDDAGLIWATTYPNCGVISFDPKSKTIKDYDYINDEKWAQYPRYIANDDKGWIYVGLGNTSSQIVAFNPSTSETKKMIKCNERLRGHAFVYTNNNGKVYGQSQQKKNQSWYEFYKGRRLDLKDHSPDPKKVITGNQALFHGVFPDGKILKKFDLVEGKLIVKNPNTNKEKTIDFSYSSNGAIVMGVGISPEGNVIGGTAFPMRYFSYNPKIGRASCRESVDNWTG